MRVAYSFVLLTSLLCLNFSQPPAKAAQETKDKQPAQENKQPAAQEKKPCVVLKQMGPADQVTSHLFSFGLRGKQFQYLEGALPKGVSFHGRLTDHDVRKIMDKGGEVRVVQSKYTAQEVEDARKSCSESGLNPAEFAAQAPSKQEASTTPSQPSAVAATPQSGGNGVQAALSTIEIKSTPDGAEITVDDKYVGSTPSTLKLTVGDHKVKLEKVGFKTWERTLTVGEGSGATINPTLEQEQKPPAEGSLSR